MVKNIHAGENWFRGDKRNIGLPEQQWHEVDNLLGEIVDILHEYGRRFDNKHIPEGESRNSIVPFSNIIVCEKPRDRDERA